ncbi:MAG: MotA/TolQ/ExbB proton channel family protein, partial [Rickettsiaceae bacterium]|nr:MotA/TolQ/ExbB proton channel family protein [Rickettsiaceae bacterium]
GIFLVTALISNGGIIIYFNLPSFLIVFGSTFAVCCACFSFREMQIALYSVYDLIFRSPLSPTEVAKLCMKSSQFCYKIGINLIGGRIAGVPLGHKLFVKWLEYVVDNEKHELIDKLVTQEIYSYHEDQSTVIQLIKKGADLAPAFGLIGTIIGLVQMLSSINDINMIGQGLSVALLTTLYGALLSYLFLFPLASKLERNLQADMTNLCIMHRTVMSIAKSQNPRELEAVINSLLPPGKNIVYFDYTNFK